MINNWDMSNSNALVADGRGSSQWEEHCREVKIHLQQHANNLFSVTQFQYKLNIYACFENCNSLHSIVNTSFVSDCDLIVRFTNHR